MLQIKYRPIHSHQLFYSLLCTNSRGEILDVETALLGGWTKKHSCTLKEYHCGSRLHCSLIGVWVFQIIFRALQERNWEELWEILTIYLLPTERRLPPFSFLLFPEDALLRVTLQERSNTITSTQKYLCKPLIPHSDRSRNYHMENSKKINWAILLYIVFLTKPNL